MEPVWLELIMGLLLGVGLSAACGFRVFLPPLALSTAGLYFQMPLPEQMLWLGTEPAFFTLLTATLLEIGAYYVPWLDNALDHIAAPAAVVAGTLITAPFLGELNPWLQWGIALVAGGGAAGSVQTLTSVTRLFSTTMTGGLANPIFSTLENLMAAVVAVVSILFPLMTLVFLALFVFLAVHFWQKLPWPWRKTQPDPTS